MRVEAGHQQLRSAIETQAESCQFIELAFNQIRRENLWNLSKRDVSGG